MNTDTVSGAQQASGHLIAPGRLWAALLTVRGNQSSIRQRVLVYRQALLDAGWP